MKGGLKCYIDREVGELGRSFSLAPSIDKILHFSSRGICTLECLLFSSGKEAEQKVLEEEEMAI